MAFPLFILLLLLSSPGAFAQDVPRFDVSQSCRGATRAGLGAQRSAEICANTEQEARESLRKAWGQFARADKERCVSTTRTGGSPSYVELITCLETARDAAKLPKDELMRPLRPR